MADVELEFSGRVEKLEQAVDRLVSGNSRLQQQYEHTAARSKESGDVAISHLSSQLSYVTNLATGYLSVSTAIQAVTSAMADQAEIQKRAKDMTASVGDAQRNMLRNLGDVTDKQQSDFIAQLTTLAEKRHPKGGMAQVYGMASGGLSASAGNREETLSAVDTALRFAPDSPEAAPEVTEGLLHLGKVTGSKDARVNLGYLKTLGEISPTKDWGKISRNLVPGVIGVAQYGGGAGAAGALVTSIAQGSADLEGRKSATAAISLAEQLERFLPEKDRYTYKHDPRHGMTPRRVLDTKGTGMTDWQQRVEYLRAHPQDRERFLNEASFEKKQKAAIQQLLEGENTMTGQYLKQGMVVMNQPLSEMAARAEAKISQMDKLQPQKVAKSGRVHQTTSETLTLDTELGKKEAEQGTYSWDQLKLHLQESGLTWSGTQAESAAWTVGGLKGKTSKERYTEAVERQIHRIEGEEKPKGLLQWGAQARYGQRMETSDEDKQKRISTLRDNLRNLEQETANPEQEKILGENLAVMREVNNGIKQIVKSNEEMNKRDSRRSSGNVQAARAGQGE